ncbi:MAG: AAA family ATPase [Pseudomonadota bacterium]
MARKRRDTTLPAPFLKRLTLIPEKMGDRKVYPMNLPWLDPDRFEISFEAPVTIIVGENGSGKSTLIEAIAALAGYDEAGGGKGYKPVDHSMALDVSGADLSTALRAGWLPKVTDGWFFKAESFFSVARYLDEAAQLDPFSPPPPDFLSHSHGEGFVRFFEERMARQGIYFMDEPESALSPNRQRDLLRVLAKIQDSATAQVIMATHSPILMAVPGATVLEMTRGGPEPVALEDTDHFKLYRDFVTDPTGFVEAALAEAEP